MSKDSVLIEIKIREEAVLRNSNKNKLTLNRMKKKMSGKPFLMSRQVISNRLNWAIYYDYY
jgi:hypothetical protein